MAKKFSIVVVYYQGCTTEQEFSECIASIRKQDEKSYELKVIHDGELIRENTVDVEIICTTTRFNDWGHSLRNIALGLINGEYVIFINADNTLCMENSLSKIAEKIESTGNKEFYLVPVVMVGLNQTLIEGTITSWYDSERDKNKLAVVSGFPLVFGNVDVMNMIVKVDAWLEIDGWHRKDEQSDYFLAKELSEKHKPIYINQLLGVHR